KEGIPVIDFRHEQAAVHAAEGWAKVTGRPGVAAITAGPGVTDGVTGITNAYQGGSPCLVIGGKSPLSQWDMGALQELDHLDIVRSVTKLARVVAETRRLPEYTSMALRHAVVGRPGPTFLEVPFDIIFGKADDENIWFPEPVLGEGKIQPDPDRVQQTVEILAQAKHPVVMAGGAIWWDQAWEPLRELIETLHCPVFLNGMGRGSIPADHPLFFSVSRRYALGQADAVVVIGTPFDFRLGFGRNFPPDAKVIQIDVDGAEIGKNRDVTVGLVGHVGATLTQLVNGLQRRLQNKPDGAWIESIRGQEEKIRASEEALMNSDATPIHPLRMVRELRDFLDRDATVVADGGDIVTFGARVINIYEPGHWLDPGALGCLGVGTGYAIAAKLARPDKQVLLLNGDGSFGLNGFDMETMVRHKLPVVSVVGNDGAWGQNKHPQLRRFGHATAQMLSQDIRYDKVVEAFGGHGELVTKPSEIRPALERAFNAGVAACVNILTDPNVGFSHGGAATH
ncbi:MAG TPA: acetolactate synthase, partial [Dehalococcoidia bacterium]|nr:acetolactate synthase [Dehalococcoidia bacterium]